MKFFLSSTYKDLKDIRKIAINTLVGIVGNSTDSTGKIIAMEYFNASENSCKEECLKELDACDVVIGIYGERYGSIDEETGLSMTEVEFDYAVKKHKPILAFVQRTGNREKREVELVKKVFALGKSCANFDGAEDFADRLNSSLQEYLGAMDGYSINSLWSQVVSLRDAIKEKIEKDVPGFDLQMMPYAPGEEDLALNYIISSAQRVKKIVPHLAEENSAIFSYAYMHEFYPGRNDEKAKEELLHNVEAISGKIQANWESIHLGLNNAATGTILATTFLKLRRMQQRLLFEPWTEDLRHEVIEVRNAYVDAILVSKYID